VLLSEVRRTNIDHAAHQLINLISRAASEAEENDRMASADFARANLTSVLKTTTGLWNSHSVDAAGILASQQRRQIQIVCAAMASVSISAAMCAIYWFCMMKRNYRRDLVLMLILGDFYKSLWYLIHGSVNFARSQVTSDESFCQVSGFMLQMGLQACGRCQSFLQSTCLVLTGQQTWPSFSLACIWRCRYSLQRVPSSAMMDYTKHAVGFLPSGSCCHASRQLWLLRIHAAHIKRKVHSAGCRYGRFGIVWRCLGFHDI
jgi:hypothetical protein